MSYLKRFKKEKEPIRSELLATRVTTEMKEQFEALCKELNLTVSEGLYRLIERELKGDEDQREQQPEKPKAAPKTRPVKRPSNTGTFITTPWQVDKKLPCPICKEWFLAKNYKRHGLRLHQKDTKELITENLETVERMVRERLAQDEVVTVRKFR